MSYHRRTILLPLALLAAGPGSAIARPAPVPASAPIAARSPFLGRWELDLTRMPATYGTPPRRVVYMFEDIGGGGRG